jgi:hypothetical protein
MEKEDLLEQQRAGNARKRRKLSLQTKVDCHTTPKTNPPQRRQRLPRVPLAEVSNSVPPILTPVSHFQTNPPNTPISQLHTQPSNSNREHLKLKKAKDIQTLGINLIHKFTEPTFPSNAPNRATATTSNQLPRRSENNYNPTTSNSLPKNQPTPNFPFQSPNTTQPSTSNTPTQVQRSGRLLRFSHPNLPSSSQQTTSRPSRKRNSPFVHFEGAGAEISDEEYEDDDTVDTSDQSDFDNIDEFSSDSDNEQQAHQPFEGNY